MKILAFVVTLFMVIAMMSSVVNAASGVNLTPNQITANIDSNSQTQITSVGGKIVGIIQVIGIVIAVVVIMVVIIVLSVRLILCYCAITRRTSSMSRSNGPLCSSLSVHIAAANLPDSSKPIPWARHHR